MDKEVSDIGSPVMTPFYTRKARVYLDLALLVIAPAAIRSLEAWVKCA